MKSIYDNYCTHSSKEVTRRYSTSFYAGIQCLDKSIQNDIHAIYGLVRFADEIVDTFHEFDKATLLSDFKKATFAAIDQKIALNPILHSFQKTVNTYAIDHALIEQFFESMEMDLQPRSYTQEAYDTYILGSAEVVGLMCLKIFVYGDEKEYERLKPYAMKLGSAFQKINFLRDLKNDYKELGRIYFPGVDAKNLREEEKRKIEAEIEKEFDEAYIGITQLPKSSRFGVYVSYIYYRTLLKRIKQKSSSELLSDRIRVSNQVKALVFAKSYLRNSFNLL